MSDRLLRFLRFLREIDSQRETLLPEDTPQAAQDAAQTACVALAARRHAAQNHA